MRARARPVSLTRASSRMVCTDSSRARSMKAQVLTTRQSAVSATSVISWPDRASIPSISSESTWFLGQPRVVKWTFMTRGYDPTRCRGESNGTSRNIAQWGATRLLGLADEHDDLARAQHLHLEGGSRWLRGEPAPDLFDIVLRAHGHIIHGENDVAAYGDLLPPDGRDLVAPQHAHVPPRRALGDRLDEEARGL